MMKKSQSLFRSERAASAAEFAMVLPLLLLFLLGIIDIGRYMWALNRAEKATQMGVRYAVVSDPVAEIINTDFVNGYSIPGGDPVPTGIFTSATCTNTGNCTISGSASESGRLPDAFDDIVERIQKFYPETQASNVRVIYENIGLGYSGDPTGPDVSPLTTVELINLTFEPIIFFGGTIGLPTIKASLTLEDADCTSSGDCGSSN